MEQEAVLTEALALPEKGRAEVATKLIRSLGAPARAMSDEEAIAEARRRSEEMDNDPSCSVGHDEFMKQFENRKK
jgi:putative addiction module component (TIGR02574 family)